MKKIQRIHPNMYRNAVDFSWRGMALKLAIVSTVVVFTPSYDREMRLIAISGSALIWIVWLLFFRKSKAT